MSKVWVLMSNYDYEGNDVVSVHSSEDSAEQARNRLLKRIERYKKAYDKWMASDLEGDSPRSFPDCHADSFTIHPFSLK